MQLRDALMTLRRLEAERKTPMSPLKSGLLESRIARAVREVTARRRELEAVLVEGIA